VYLRCYRQRHTALALISTARLSPEIWNQLKDDDWSLVSAATFISNWPHRLWDMTKHHHLHREEMFLLPWRRRR
jgi:hypothetical protein